MIETSTIPECVWMDMASTLQSVVMNFYKDPENRKAFEEWKAERREKHEQTDQA